MNSYSHSRSGWKYSLICILFGRFSGNVVKMWTKIGWKPGDYAAYKDDDSLHHNRECGVISCSQRNYCYNNKLLTQTGGNPKTRKSTCSDKK